MIAVGLIIFQQQSGKTKIVFCDVGQGDGIYIRTKNKIDILIDAGPNNAILNCLGKQMPFFDRQIDYVFISHPQADHYSGLLTIAERYQIKHLIITPLYADSKKYQKLIELTQSKKSQISKAVAGQQFIIDDNIKLKIIWPNQNFANANSLDEKILGATTLLTSSSDPNNFSQVILFQQGNFDILFTGDIPIDILQRLIDDGSSLSGISLEAMKIPHHGSLSGISDNILSALDPQLAVISVGKNAYGHPAKKLLQWLKEDNIGYKTTRDDGDIIIRINEKGWEYETQN